MKSFKEIREARFTPSQLRVKAEKMYKALEKAKKEIKAFHDWLDSGNYPGNKFKQGAYPNVFTSVPYPEDIENLIKSKDAFEQDLKLWTK